MLAHVAQTSAHVAQTSAQVTQTSPQATHHSTGASRDANQSEAAAASHAVNTSTQETQMLAHVAQTSAQMTQTSPQATHHSTGASRDASQPAAAASSDAATSYAATVSKSAKHAATSPNRPTQGLVASGGGKPIFIGARNTSHKVIDSSKCDQSTSPKDKSSESKQPKPLKGWQKVDNRNKNKNNANNNKLSGMKQGQTCDLYVQNIEKFEGDSLGDIASRVRNHCKENGVRVTNARVITNKFCNDAVSCKISVPITHADKALGIHIWPDSVKCRRWKTDPPRNATPEMTQSKQQEPRRGRSRSRGSRRNSRAPQSRSRSRGARSQSRQSRSPARSALRRESPRRRSRSGQNRSQSRVRYNDVIDYEASDKWWNANERNDKDTDDDEWERYVSKNTNEVFYKAKSNGHNN